jgi:hypothetical protein
MNADMLPKGSENFGFTLGIKPYMETRQAVAHYIVGSRGPIITKITVTVMDRWTINAEEIEISSLFSPIQRAAIENMIAVRIQNAEECASG